MLKMPATDLQRHLGVLAEDPPGMLNNMGEGDDVQVGD